MTQETRGWVEERGATVSQRSKEYAHDYRYFPEPDLPPLRIGAEWVRELRAELPELAPQRQARFQSDYGLSEYDAGLLTGARRMADYFRGRGGPARRRCGQRNRQLDPGRPVAAAQPASLRHRRFAGNAGRAGGATRADCQQQPVHIASENRSGGYVRHRRWGGRQRARQRVVSNQRHRRYRGRRGRGHSRQPRGGVRLSERQRECRPFSDGAG